MPKNPVPPRFHLLAKLSGATCNLACTYCFFLDKELLYPNSRFRMTEETLAAYLQQLIAAHRSSQVTGAWLGGEPTLMGVDFYGKAIQFQEQYRRPGMVFENTLQTSGTLLDDEWCEFLSVSFQYAEDAQGVAQVLRTKELEQTIDDGPGKSLRIHRATGWRPIMAAANSNGDIARLKYAVGHPCFGAGSAGTSRRPRARVCIRRRRGRSAATGAERGMDRRQHKERLEDGILIICCLKSARALPRCTGNDGPRWMKRVIDRDHSHHLPTGEHDGNFCDR